MIRTIEDAAKNFCSHQLSMKCENQGTYDNEEMHIAYIDVTTKSDEKYRVFLAVNTTFIQNVATLFLEETQSDKETLRDMTLETANLIIGSAKVVAEESKNPYDIGTPSFEGVTAFDMEYDDMITLFNAENKLIIAIKRLNA